MSELPGVMIALVAGFGIGLGYFGGLWLTIRRLPGSRHPALLIVGSYLLRLALVLGGVYLFIVFSGGWQQVLAYVLGFTLARIILTRRWGKLTAADGSAEQCT